MGLCDCLSGPKLPDEDGVPTVRSSGSVKRPEPQTSNSSARQRPRAVQAPTSNGRHLPKRARQYPDRDPLAQMQNSRYRKVADLNDGTSGFVQLAEDVHSQQLVAIKFLPRGKKLIKDADREICNLRLCCMHPYIIKFKEAFLTDHNLAIVSEYASAGDLADFIEARRSQGRTPRGLPESHARQLFQQLMVAVDFCHQKGIVNRDLKLENVLLTVDKPNLDKAVVELPNVRLCDFGFSKDEAVDSICKTACGTPEYVAPEVLITNQYSGRAADIWSAGVVLYVMLTGQFPFQAAAGGEDVTQQNKLKAIFPRIVNAQFTRPTWVSQASCELLEGMLQPDLKRRFSLADVLAHPWFTEGLPASLLDTNANLLKVSDMLLTSVAPQTEDEILSIVTEAMDLPRRRNRGGPTGRRSHTPSLPPLQEQRAPQQPPALEQSPRSSRSTRAPPAPSHLLSAIPGRWRMDPAAQQDYQPRANSLYPNHHLQQPQHQQPANHSAYKQQHQQQQQQLPGSRDQVRRQQQLQQDDAFRTFSIASSESASSVRSRQKPPAAGLRSRSPGSAECSSPGSSYDDLFADNPVMPSMNGNSRAHKQAPPKLTEAGWSVTDAAPRRSISMSGFGAAPGEYGRTPWGQWGSPGPAPRGSANGIGGSSSAPRGSSHMGNGGSTRAPSAYQNGGGPSSYQDRLYPLEGQKPLKGSMWAEQNKPRRGNSWGRGQQQLAPQSSAASQPSLAGAWNLDWQRSSASQASMLAGMQPRGGRPPPRLPPSYEEEESRAAAGRRRLASPDWVRQEVARNKWSPLRDQQASTVGSLTDSEELLDDRHLEEQLRHSHQPPPHDGVMSSRGAGKHGHSPQGSHGSAASRILDSPSASAASSLPYPPTPARIRTHVGTSRY